jgi:hypothetical protein
MQKFFRVCCVFRGSRNSPLESALEKPHRPLCAAAMDELVFEVTQKADGGFCGGMFVGEHRHASRHMEGTAQECEGSRRRVLFRQAQGLQSDSEDTFLKIIRADSCAFVA